jgi:hypothetical protein
MEVLGVKRILLRRSKVTSSSELRASLRLCICILLRRIMDAISCVESSVFRDRVTDRKLLQQCEIYLIDSLLLTSRSFYRLDGLKQALQR